MVLLLEREERPLRLEPQHDLPDRLQLARVDEAVLSDDVNVTEML